MYIPPSCRQPTTNRSHLVPEASTSKASPAPVPSPRLNKLMYESKITTRLNQVHLNTCDGHWPCSWGRWACWRRRLTSGARCRAACPAAWAGAAGSSARRPVAAPAAAVNTQRAVQDSFARLLSISKCSDVENIYMLKCTQHQSHVITIHFLLTCTCTILVLTEGAVLPMVQHLFDVVFRTQWRQFFPCK